MTEQKIIQWPADGSTVEFEDLLEPLRDLADQLFEIKDRTVDGGPPPISYVGYDVHLPTDFGVVESFSPDVLSWSVEQHGNDAMFHLLRLALQLGIEQGRRVEANDPMRLFKERLARLGET